MNFILLVSLNLRLLIYKEETTVTIYLSLRIKRKEIYVHKALRRALEISLVINENIGLLKYLEFGKRRKRWGAK